ncbi:hypothetical protein [Halobellus rarus]|uniref:Uncharacterized protein n=1 Tax=Halobellus rarus TaxID=1126237 RepID=A0ABD6CPM2_9EURY|nr:hypothetical protein [Halobellus rarus]
MRTRQVLALAAVFALVAVSVGAAGLAVADDHAGDDSDSDAVSADELTLEDLRSDGTRHGNSPDSVRLDGERMMWVIHWPADAMSSNPGDPQDDSWRYLSPGETVDRNSVWLRTINLNDVEETTVHVAYYEIGEREVRVGENTTRTEQYAKNVSTEEHNVTLQRGWVMQEIPLRQSDDPREVTMWVEGSEELRWTFTHESIATTEGLPFSTWGGALRWASLVLILPIGIGGVLSLAGSKAIVRRTGVGPQWGFGLWSAAFAILAFIIVVSFWGDLANLLVEHPYALAIFVIAYLFVLMLETFDHGVRRIRFEKSDLTPTSSPAGDRAVDELSEREQTLTVISREDQPLSVATPGLIPFLARLIGGGAAVLRTVDPEHENADERGETDTVQDPLTCRVPVKEGHVDEKVYVHPLSPDVVDFEPEHFEINVPAPESADEWLSFGVRAFAMLAAVAFAMSIAGTVAGFLTLVAGVAWIAVRPVEGYARVWAAPAHYRSARATAISLAEETDDAQTIEREREKRIQSEITTQRDIMEAVDSRDKTLIDGMFGVDEEVLDGGD